MLFCFSPLFLPITLYWSWLRYFPFAHTCVKLVFLDFSKMWLRVVFFMSWCSWFWFSFFLFFLSVKIHIHLLFEISWLFLSFGPSLFVSVVQILTEFWFHSKKLLPNVGFSLEKEFWLFLFNTSCGPDCFNLFQTLPWAPCDHPLALGKMISSFCCCCQISWSYFLGIPVHCFVLSFSDPSDIPWLPSVFSRAGTGAMWILWVLLVYCYLCLSVDLWGYLVSWFQCKSGFVFPSSWLLFYVEIQGDSSEKCFNV